MSSLIDLLMEYWMVDDALLLDSDSVVLVVYLVLIVRQRFCSPSGVSGP